MSVTDLGGQQRRVDVTTADASLARLAELTFDTAVFGHGPAVRGRAVEKFKELSGGAATP